MAQKVTQISHFFHDILLKQHKYIYFITCYLAEYKPSSDVVSTLMIQQRQHAGSP